MKISVALCTFNGEKYLRQQLDSILNQDQFSVAEIVVGDDGSTDETLKILSDYQEKYPLLFKINKNITNLGSTKNFEKTIADCTGDYIFLSDQDDVWKTSKISKTLSIFENNSTTEGVFSNAELIDENLQSYSDQTLWDSIFFIEKELIKPIDLFEIIAKNGNVVTGATLCIKKEVKSMIFPFKTSILHDEWIASILSLRETLLYSDENLISYRIHQNQQVGVAKSSKIEKKNKQKRLVLGLIKPRTFIEYRAIYKKKYIFKNSFSKFDLNFIEPDLLESKKTKSIQEFKEFENLIKHKFPIQYWISKLVDRFQNKRK